MSFVPNKNLIQHNFNGYKLAPNRLNFVSKKFSNGVKVTKLKEQFSYQHVRAFSLHNHLFGDPWFTNVVYWCTSDAILCGEVSVLDIFAMYWSVEKQFCLLICIATWMAHTGVK